MHRTIMYLGHLTLNTNMLSSNIQTQHVRNLHARSKPWQPSVAVIAFHAYAVEVAGGGARGIVEDEEARIARIVPAVRCTLGR